MAKKGTAAGFTSSSGRREDPTIGDQFSGKELKGDDMQAFITRPGRFTKPRSPHDVNLPVEGTQPLSTLHRLYLGEARGKKRAVTKPRSLSKR